jgi:hypothetical protein
MPIFTFGRWSQIQDCLDPTPIHKIKIKSFESKSGGYKKSGDGSHLVVPRSQDPKRPLRSPKSHAKTKSLYSGLSSRSPTSPTQRVCTESPEPHPSRVFIGEGQEAGLPILGVNRLDVIQVRGSWHIGIGFYSIVSWSSGVWPELFFFGHLGQGPALLNYDWIRAEVVHSRGGFMPRLWCIPGERLCSGQC